MTRNPLRRTLERVFPDAPAAWFMALSLLLAVLFWGYTVSEEKALKDLSVPLAFANVPKDMTVVGDDVRRLVTVEVKGSPDMLKRVREEDVDAKVDVGRLLPGPQVMELGQENVRLPSSVEFVKAYPRTIHFILDRVVKSSLPLQPAFAGRTAPGTQVLSWSIEPSTVELEGPETAIRKLRHVPTQTVPLEGRAQDFQVPVVPSPSDADISVASLGAFTLKVVIGETRAQRTIAPVAVTVLHSKHDAAVSPDSIKVMVDGPESVVRGLGPRDLVAEVDVAGLSPSEKPYQLRPAVRFSNPALAGRVEITSWTQRYVDVLVSPQAEPATGGGEAH